MAQIGRSEEKAVKNSNLSEAILTLLRPIWARSRWIGPKSPAKGVKNPRRYAPSPSVFSCFPGLSEPTQLHPVIGFRP